MTALKIVSNATLVFNIENKINIKSFEADTFSSKSKNTLQDKIKILICWAKKHDTFNL